MKGVDMVWAMVFLPLAGTVLGSALVFFTKNELGDKSGRFLTGFASGVMVAASIWSLLIPALENAGGMGKLAFLPVVLGFCAGIGFLLLLDSTIPHLHLNDECPEGAKCNFKNSTLMVLAVTLHNIPEGMAVGVVCAEFISGSDYVSAAGLLAIALGIAIQNFPEGAIISLPLRDRGSSRKKAFAMGALSGIVEPLASIVTILLTAVLLPALPFLLSFAAGAMMYVVVEELIPEMSAGKHSNIGVIAFTAGFALMMILDTALA